MQLSALRFRCSRARGWAAALFFSLGFSAVASAQPAKGAVSVSKPAAAGEKAPAKPVKTDEVAVRGKQPARAHASPKKAAAGKSEQKGGIVSGIHCPNGALEDPHRGFVRCLLPEEKGAPWLPPAPQPEPPAPVVEAPAPVAPVPAPVAPVPAPAVPLEPPALEIKSPKFENGEVPAAEKALNKISKEISLCVAENGGLEKASGTLKVQFLVRARGRAEGVEVLSAQGVPEGAGACVQKLLKNRSVGHPTADPVGVTVVLQFKRQGVAKN